MPNNRQDILHLTDLKFRSVNRIIGSRQNTNKYKQMFQKNSDINRAYWTECIDKQNATILMKDN